MGSLEGKNTPIAFVGSTQVARRIGIAKMVGVGYGGLYSKEAQVGFRKIGLGGTTSRGLDPCGGRCVCAYALGATLPQ